jgi:hypothetical protein
MKAIHLVVLLGTLALVGCSTYRGGTGDSQESSTGTYSNGPNYDFPRRNVGRPEPPDMQTYPEMAFPPIQTP